MKVNYKMGNRLLNLFLLLLLLVPMLSSANEQQQLFESGNKLYAKGKYEQAIKTYNQILSDDYESAEVYYNLGNTYYRINDIPSALLNYEKAKKLNPRDEDIDVNIQFANLKTVDKIEPAPELFLNNWWHSLLFLFSLNGWAYLTIYLFITTAFIGVLYLFTESVSLKKASFYTGVVMLLLSLFSILLSFKQSSYVQSVHQAIVFDAAVNVKSEPSIKAKNLFVLHAGVKVSVVENNTEWIKVKLLNGNEGWILFKSIKLI